MGVKSGDQGRALSARCDVCGAQVIDHRNAGGFSKLRGVQQLKRKALAGAVANRLPVGADRGDIAGREACAIDGLPRALGVEVSEFERYPRGKLEFAWGRGLQRLNRLPQRIREGHRNARQRLEALG